MALTENWRFDHLVSSGACSGRVSSQNHHKLPNARSQKPQTIRCNDHEGTQ
jgi:hypothetical protein